MLPVELTGPRAVVVGTGNVALDLARILLSDERRLVGMDLPTRGPPYARGKRDP